MNGIKTAIGAIGLCLGATIAWATADGPDYWRVNGVDANDVLNLRAGPTWKSNKIGEIPHDADGLANYICIGGMSFTEFQTATEAEREAARKTVWCRVGYRDRIGWVAGRYLQEGDQSAESHTEFLDEFTGTTWVLVDLAGTPPGAEAFISFSGDGVSGNGACNNFRARYLDDDDGQRFGPIAATRKACLSTPHHPDRISIAETETRFFDALENARSLIQGNDVMALFDAADRVVAILQRAPD